MFHPSQNKLTHPGHLKALCSVLLSHLKQKKQKQNTDIPTKVTLPLVRYGQNVCVDVISPATVLSAWAQTLSPPPDKVCSVLYIILQYILQSLSNTFCWNKQHHYTQALWWELLFICTVHIFNLVVIVLVRDGFNTQQQKTMTACLWERALTVCTVQKMIATHMVHSCPPSEPGNVDRHIHTQNHACTLTPNKHSNPGLLWSCLMIPPLAS